MRISGHSPRVTLCPVTLGPPDNGLRVTLCTVTPGPPDNVASLSQHLRRSLICRFSSESYTKGKDCPKGWRLRTFPKETQCVHLETVVRNFFTKKKGWKHPLCVPAHTYWTQLQSPGLTAKQASHDPAPLHVLEQKNQPWPGVTR